MLACSGAEYRDPGFVPPAQLQSLRTALVSSGQDLWSEVSFLAPASDDLLLIDLRLASALGAKDFSRVCSVASEVVSARSPPIEGYRVRIIREWRVIHEC
jgi:hypothetical protein